MQDCCGLTPVVIKQPHGLSIPSLQENTGKTYNEKPHGLRYRQADHPPITIIGRLDFG